MAFWGEEVVVEGLVGWNNSSNSSKLRVIKVNLKNYINDKVRLVKAWFRFYGS